MIDKEMIRASTRSSATTPDATTMLYFSFDAVVTILFVLSAARQLTEGHNWGDDFGLYIQLADNIVNGRPYNDLNSGIQVPPGFPILLAAWGKVFGFSFVSLKSLNIVSWVAAAWIAWILAEKSVGRVAASCVLLAHFLLPAYYVQQQSVLSDLPFVAFVDLLLLLSFVFFCALREARRCNVYLLIAIPITLFCTLLIRPAGLPLVGAIALAASFEAVRYRHDRKRVLCALGLAAMVLATSCVYIFAFGASAGGHLTNALQGLVGSGISGVLVLPRLLVIRASEELLNLNVLLAWYPPKLWFEILLVFGIALGGVAYLLLTRDLVVPLYFGAYTTLVLLIPWQQGYRYLLPLTSIVFLFFASPIRLLTGYLRSTIGRASVIGLAGMAGAVLFLLVAGAGAVRGLGEVYGYDDDETSDPRTKALVAWLKQNTSADDRLCAFKPRAVMFFVKRRACYIPNDLEAEVVSFVKSQGSSYAVLILRPAYGYKRLRESLSKSAAATNVFQNEDYVVYKLR